MSKTPAPPPGLHRRGVSLPGGEREYFVHVPGRSPAGESSRWPVVLAFHGGNSHAEMMLEFSGLHEKGEEAGFLAVFPNGTGRRPDTRFWNGGNCCGPAMRDGVDDVAFVDALLDDLARFAPVDSRRVFAAGMSNGAVLTYRLASELSERICAIGPVAGPMGTPHCRPARPVPVCHFHGTRDDYVPFEGGIGLRSLSRARFFSVEYTIGRWVAANGCGEDPQIDELPVQHEDGTHVRRTVYRGGAAAAEVALYTIFGGGHTWPGRETSLTFLGHVTRNVNANDVLWEFFERHARQEESLGD